MRNRDAKERLRMLAAGAALIGSFAIGTTGTMLAYLTHVGPTLYNNFTIALDTTTTIVEKYPTPDPNLNGLVASFEKAVQVANTGDVDAYVRVKVNFSESELEGKSAFSQDNANWYAVSQYRSHLPANWVYRDGWYYYNKVLEAGHWDGMKGSFNKDGHFEHTYKGGVGIVANAGITTPLFRYVKTTYDNPADMRGYELLVTQESCPSYYGNDAVSAFASYEADR